MKTILCLWMLVLLPIMTRAATEMSPADEAAFKSASKYVVRGNEFAEKDSFARAKGEYLKALKIFPQHYDALYNVAVMCTRLNQIDDAAGYYQEYLKLKPDDADVWTQLGVLYDDSGRKVEAQAAYEKALAAQPNFGRAHHNFGVLLKEQGHMKEAGEHLRKYVELEEAAGHHNGDAYYSLGTYYLGLGKAREAKLALQSAIEIEPNSALFNNAMGDVYLLEKEPKVAQVYYKQALDKDPQYVLAYSGMGDAYGQLGDVPTAAKNYRKALELRADYYVIQFKLGELYEATQPAEAIKHFEKYLASGKNLAFEKQAKERLAVLKPLAEIQQIK